MRKNNKIDVFQLQRTDGCTRLAEYLLAKTPTHFKYTRLQHICILGIDFVLVGRDIYHDDLNIVVYSIYVHIFTLRYLHFTNISILIFIIYVPHMSFLFLFLCFYVLFFLFFLFYYCWQIWIWAHLFLLFNRGFFFGQYINGDKMWRDIVRPTVFETVTPIGDGTLIWKIGTYYCWWISYTTFNKWLYFFFVLFFVFVLSRFAFDCTYIQYNI